jgi:hypothetical protein
MQSINKPSSVAQAPQVHPSHGFHSAWKRKGLKLEDPSQGGNGSKQTGIHYRPRIPPKVSSELGERSPGVEKQKATCRMNRTVLLEYMCEVFFHHYRQVVVSREHRKQSRVSNKVRGVVSSRSAESCGELEVCGKEESGSEMP